MAYIHDLLAEARTGNPNAAQEVFDFIDHVLEHPTRTVASAFGLAQRGGDPRRQQRIERDVLIRTAARRLPPGMNIGQRVRAIEGDLELLRSVEKIGLPIPDERRLRDIIKNSKPI